MRRMPMGRIHEASRERRNKSSFKLLKETFIVIKLERGWDGVEVVSNIGKPSEFKPTKSYDD